MSKGMDRKKETKKKPTRPGWGRALRPRDTGVSAEDSGTQEHISMKE